MSSVQARRRNGSWDVRAKKRTMKDCRAIVDPDRQVVYATGIVAKQAARFKDELWQLELSKSLFEHDLSLAGAALEFASRCAASSEDQLDWSVPNAQRAARAVRAELSRMGMPVVGLWKDRLLEWLVFLGAVVAASLAWFGFVIVSFPLFARKLDVEDTIFALHAEKSTRTKALLPPNMRPTGRISYMMIGRRSSSPGSLRRTLNLDQLDWKPVIFRPGSVSSGVKSLAVVLNKLVRGWAEISNCTVLPAFQELVAIIFRMFLGQCQARWWLDSGLKPSTVIYGHTGLADTTALERAQQSCGTKTLHLVHGVSAGWNFAGVSDMAIFQCGYDARWHRSLPAYGATTWLGCDIPRIRQGGHDWVLLSNYIHPMNKHLASEGAAHELALINMVVEAAARVERSPRRILWKPHPTFGEVDADIRTTVQSYLANKSVGIWPMDKPFDEIAAAEHILTTPSTVALDALRLGKVPIVVSSRPYQRDTVTGALPTQAGDAGELSAIIDELTSQRAYAAAFQRCWSIAEPGRSLRPDALFELVGEDVAVEVKPMWSGSDVRNTVAVSG